MEEALNFDIPLYLLEDPLYLPSSGLSYEYFLREEPSLLRVHNALRAYFDPKEIFSRRSLETKIRKLMIT